MVYLPAHASKNRTPGIQNHPRSLRNCLLASKTTLQDSFNFMRGWRQKRSLHESAAPFSGAGRFEHPSSFVQKSGLSFSYTACALPPARRIILDSGHHNSGPEIVPENDSQSYENGTQNDPEINEKSFQDECRKR